MLSLMDNRHRVELRVFVQSGCDHCQRAGQLARDVARDHPRLAVRVIDIAGQATDRDDLFAVPTFVLNGQVFSLGNPRPDDLCREIQRLLKVRRSV